MKFVFIFLSFPTQPGARIEIGNESEGSDTRTCIISGTQTEIDCAKQLINEKIMEEKEFRARKKKPDLGTQVLKYAKFLF